MDELHLVGISHTTQTNFLKWLGEEGVSVGLERATKLLHELHHVQIRDNVEKQSMIDYNVFFFCLPHVRSLKDKFRAARQSFPMIKGSRELCELLVGCARYVPVSSKVPYLLGKWPKMLMLFNIDTCYTKAFFQRSWT